MQNQKMFHLYEGYFGGLLVRDGFGLQGEGRLFINGESGTVELSAGRALPMLFNIPLKLLTFSRLFRTRHRPPATYAFPVNQIKDFTQENRVIRFSAPDKSGRIKQTRFTAQSEAEAQEITNLINGLKLMQPSPLANSGLA